MGGIYWGVAIMSNHDRQVRRETLANGLRLVWLPMPHAHTVHITAVVRAGSHYETSKNNGVSHLLEHLHLTTSRKYPTRQTMNDAFANIPGNRNGHTCPSMVQFDISTISEKLAPACDYMAEVLEIREFDEETIRAEKAVLTVEMRAPHDNTWEDAVSFLFANRRLGLLQGGTADGFGKITNEAVHEFQRWAFCPSRMVVAIAGSFAESDLDLARKCFGRLAKGAPPPAIREPTPRRLPVIRRVANIEWRNGILLNFTTNQMANRVEYSCLIFLYYAMFHPCSPLHVSLRYGQSSIYHVYCHPFSVFNHWLFPIYAHANCKEQHWFAESVCKFLKSIRDGVVHQDWFEQSRGTLIHYLLDSMNNPSSVATSLAIGEVALPEHLRASYEEEVATLRTIQPSDLIAFACKTFRLENLLVQRTRHPWQTDRHIRRAISTLA